jgi:tetratricopeptide (TPR) repeat protein
MMKREVIYIVLTALLLAGCAGRKAAAPAAGRYERVPIKEVTQEQLALDAMLIDAVSLQERGDRDGALSAYAKLAAAAPSAAAAWYEMGQLLMQKGWTDSAYRCTQRAVDINGDNVWYLLALAQVQQKRGDSKGATATWERIVRQNPEVLEYYYELSNSYITAGNLPAAVEVLNRVERRIGVTEPISLQKQRLWEAAGKQDKAVKEVEALADAMPQEKRYSAILAEMNMQQKRYSKAKRYYDRILAADPDDEYIHIQLAEYYKQTGQPAAADSEMVKAFRHPALGCRTKIQLLSSFYTPDEFYGSRSGVTYRLLESIMGECEDSAEFAPFYGDVLMRQRRFDEAERQFAQSLQRDSSRYEIWEAMLICLAEQPEKEQVLLGYAQRASRLFPIQTLPLYIQGLYYVRHEQYDKALEPLERAAKWGFNKGYLEADTRGLMAECFYRTGQYERAWRAFEQYVKLRPDDWGMLNNYAYYLAERGVQLEKAEQMSRRTVEAEPDNANSLDTYAWILHLLGRDAEALPYMEKAVRLDPKSDTLRQHLDTIKKTVGR